MSPSWTSIQFSKCSMRFSRIAVSTSALRVPGFSPRPIWAPWSARKTYQHSVLPQGWPTLAAPSSSGCTCAEPGAQIGLGLKPGTSKAEVERAIRETRLEHLLKWIDVHEGEMIYVDAGTVHAIGGGAVIVETQQNSDTTSRFYDYGRQRELHKIGRAHV